MVLIDLQKAFGTINHGILLKKMSALRFSDYFINWFKLHLLNRSFQANIKDKYSCIAKIDCGVPEGSILGPLLFLLFVNDMNEAVDFDLFLYVDDSCLVHQHKEAKDFLYVSDRFKDNKLSIHFREDKAKCNYLTQNADLIKSVVQ